MNMKIHLSSDIAKMKPHKHGLHTLAWHVVNTACRPGGVRFVLEPVVEKFNVTRDQRPPRFDL